MELPRHALGIFLAQLLAIFLIVLWIEIDGGFRIDVELPFFQYHNLAQAFRVGRIVSLLGGSFPRKTVCTTSMRSSLQYRDGIGELEIGGDGCRREYLRLETRTCEEHLPCPSTCLESKSRTQTKNTPVKVFILFQ